MVAVGPAWALRARAVGGLAVAEHAAADGGRRVAAAGGVAPGLAPGRLHVGDGRAGVARTLPVACTRPAPSFGGEPARRAGPIAETCSGIGSSRLIAPISGFRNRIFRRCPRRPTRASRRRGGRARRGRTRPCPRASPARAPCVRRAVKPVEMPKSMRPGASAFSVASALAATGAMRFDGISTPVASRIVDVCTAAARHRDEELGVEELRVVEPGARVAQLLGALDDLPGVRGGRQEDAVVHGHAGIFGGRRARASDPPARCRPCPARAAACPRSWCSSRTSA